MKQYQIKKRKKLIIVVMCCIALLASATTILATEIAANGISLPADDNQYLELKAVEVKDVEGQNKQVVMNLIGHNLEFRRI